MPALPLLILPSLSWDQSWAHHPLLTLGEQGGGERTSLIHPDPNFTALDGANISSMGSWGGRGEKLFDSVLSKSPFYVFSQWRSAQTQADAGLPSSSSLAFLAHLQPQLEPCTHSPGCIRALGGRFWTDGPRHCGLLPTLGERSREGTPHSPSLTLGKWVAAAELPGCFEPAAPISVV